MKLKHCPFCSYEKVQKDIDKVSCPKCGAVVYLTWWNNRPHSDILKKALDTLLKAVQFSLDENVNRKTITGRLKHALIESKRILSHEVQLQVSKDQDKKQ